MTVPEKLRIAVVSTPRSGNTWIHRLIASAYQLPSLGRHSLADEDWDSLPDECVMQIHWRREPDFRAQLERHGFRVVSVARHPLDTLISILHVVIYDVESENWLLGRKGDETPIWGAWPRSRAFLEYCRGHRAAELLAVTTDWWGQPGVVAVRYEDFVHDAATQLKNLIPHFGPHRCQSLDDVLEKVSIRQLRKGSLNNHFWKGQPGLWREFLPAAEAYQIGWAIKGVLDTLGYPLDPDPDLDAVAADRKWLSLVGPELGATLRKNTEGYKNLLREAYDSAERSRVEAERIRGECDTARTELDRRASELSTVAEAARFERDEVQALLTTCRAELAETGGRLAVVEPQLFELRNELTAVHAEAAAFREVLGDAQSKLVAAGGEVASSRAAAATLETDLAAYQTDLAATRAEQAIIATDRDTTRSELHRTVEYLQQVENKLTDCAKGWADSQIELNGTRTTLVETRQSLAGMRLDLDDARGDLADCRVERDKARHDVVRLRSHTAALEAELERYRGLQGLSVRMAWRMQRVRNRLPWFARVAKRLVVWR